MDQTRVDELTTDIPSPQVLFLYKPNLIRFWKSSRSDMIFRVFVHVKYTNSRIKWIIGNIEHNTSNMSGLKHETNSEEI